jgi:NADH-quinone oxidoreductase E subunit
MSSSKEVQLPAEFEERVAEIIQRYPQAQSAVMPALYLAQEHFGYINNDAVNWVSAKVDMAPVKVMEIATFYTMYYKHALGKYHIQVCRTLPCALAGAGKLIDFLKKRLGVQAGEPTNDGLWSFEEVECLGSCGTAPLCQINDRYFENLTCDDLEKILIALEQEPADLRLSGLTDSLGKGLPEYPVSQIEKCS